MRFMVEPPPLSRCACGGDMRLKQVESADRALGKQKEIFVCAKCGYEHAYAVDPNPYVGPRLFDSDNELRTRDPSLARFI